jgi:hypothetical protein
MLPCAMPSQSLMWAISSSHVHALVFVNITTRDVEAGLIITCSRFDHLHKSMSSSNELRVSRTLGALLGVHCGDAIGATFEFKP